MSAKRKHVEVNPNPLGLFARKSTMKQDEADDLALYVLIWLDAIKRGAATNPVINAMTEQLATCVVLWRILGNKSMELVAVEGWNLWAKACKRHPNEPPQLTTTEYLGMRKALNYYMRAMQKVEMGKLVEASQTAVRFCSNNLAAS